MVRFADDWCLMVHGTKADAGALREEIAEVLAHDGPAPVRGKDLITHIDEGLDFLGWRIQRHRETRRGQAVRLHLPGTQVRQGSDGKVKMLCRRMDTSQPLDALLRQLNPALRGWCAYFRPGVSSATFSYLSHYTWQQVSRWLRRKHHRTTWKDLRRRYCDDGWWRPSRMKDSLFNPAKVSPTRYRYRGAVIRRRGRPPGQRQP